MKRASCRQSVFSLWLALRIQLTEPPGVVRQAPTTTRAHTAKHPRPSTLSIAVMFPKQVRPRSTMMRASRQGKSTSPPPHLAEHNGKAMTPITATMMISQTLKTLRRLRLSILPSSNKKKVQEPIETAQRRPKTGSTDGRNIRDFFPKSACKPFAGLTS
jgi:hypothetical protein